ncbi:hypothetical protein MVEN_00107400 [Mycena venus]|uniref:Uncharacterized protein n=1 Tax=Mycena venus TaxID=2733690 RepID=A0A8H6Z519_9AGAR|nr:hypothetical protein MVEN_00107400 [Mycena venus]
MDEKEKTKRGDGKQVHTDTRHLLNIRGIPTTSQGTAPSLSYIFQYLQVNRVPGGPTMPEDNADDAEAFPIGATVWYTNEARQRVSVVIRRKWYDNYGREAWEFWDDHYSEVEIALSIAAGADPPRGIFGKNAAIAYCLSMKPRQRPLARYALSSRLTAPLASSYNVSIGPHVPPMSWDRRDRSSASTALLGTARARRGCCCPWFFLSTTTPAHPFRAHPLARRSGYAVPYILLLKLCTVPAVSEEISTGGTLLWSCMHLFAKNRRVHNAYCISRHDPLKRRGPRTLLPRLREVAHICPCTRSPFPNSLPPLWVRCALLQGPPVFAPSPLSCCARAAPARWRADLRTAAHVQRDIEACFPAADAPRSWRIAIGGAGCALHTQMRTSPWHAGERSVQYSGSVHAFWEPIPPPARAMGSKYRRNMTSTICIKTCFYAFKVLLIFEGKFAVVVVNDAEDI